MPIYLRNALSAISIIAVLSANQGAIAATASGPRTTRRTLREDIRRSQEPSMPRLDITVTSCPTAVTYARTSGFGPFALEIPYHWSYYYRTGVPIAKSHSNLLRYGFLHVAQDKVYPGKYHGPQVDFIRMSGTEVQKFMRQLRSTGSQGNTWSKELIDGRQADILEFPLGRGGKVTREGTGGRYYFLRWEASVGGRVSAKKDLGLVLWKHAKGDSDFECGVNHMLAALDLDAFADLFGREFPGK